MAVDSKRGLEVWMSTLGAGVVLYMRNDLRKFSNYSKVSYDQLPSAKGHSEELKKRAVAAFYSPAEVFR